MAATLAELSAQIEALNVKDQPFLLKMNNNQIIGSWNILDAKWLSLIEANQANKNYTVTFTLDEANHTYDYTDNLQQSDSSLGTSGGHVGKELQLGKVKGMQAGLEIGFGVKDKDKPVQAVGVVSYDFNTDRIKRPIQETLEKNGWSKKKGFFAKIFGS